ncbi:hypothetical protein [Alloactinosynnema sp. L-07]|nr:hypothetical protein [Alloactinosynnema sp. L-07]
MDCLLVRGAHPSWTPTEGYVDNDRDVEGRTEFLGGFRCAASGLRVATRMRQAGPHPSFLLLCAFLQRRG